MPGWGIGGWGFTPWGGAVPAALPGANPPYIVLRLPDPGTELVPPDAAIRVGFFDLDLNLNTLSTRIYINGAVAYSGATGFTAGYTGTAQFIAGVYVVYLAKLVGWGYGQTITVRGYIEDAGGLIADDTWSWTTLENPICYTGLSPLQCEIDIQSPLTTYLDLEPIRLQLFDVVLKLATYPASSRNRENKAARVIYQQAFSSELAPLLNSRVAKNTKALAVVVCEKQRVIVINDALEPLKDRLQAAITQFYNTRALGSEYMGVLNDYLESLIYSYRVSLACNLVFLAKAIELG